MNSSQFDEPDAGFETISESNSNKHIDSPAQKCGYVPHIQLQFQKDNDGLSSDICMLQDRDK
jgi:hypothetical protein